MPPRPPMIAVCGAGDADRPTADLAEEVGFELARAGAVVVCGGLGGVMEAACRGGKRGGGTTVGIVPGETTRTASDHVDIPIATGMAEGRNVIIIHTADAVIALSGSYGTLSEVALALKMGKPVISLGGPYVDRRVIQAKDAADAVRQALAAVGRA